jgi:hypothetical protein
MRRSGMYDRWRLIVMAAGLLVGAQMVGCGGQGEVRPTQEPATTETRTQQPEETLQALPGTDDAITREDAFDLLPHLLLQEEDVPSDLRVLDSGFTTLDDLAPLSDSPARARRLLESWEFVLGYSKEYATDYPEGVYWLGVEIWALGDKERAEEAFIDGALLSDYPDVNEEEIVEFPHFGDDSVAFRLAGQTLAFTAEPTQMEGYMVLVRVDRFLAMFVTQSVPGQSSQAEAEQLAAALEARMRGQ